MVLHLESNQQCRTIPTKINIMKVMPCCSSSLTADDNKSEKHKLRDIYKMMAWHAIFKNGSIIQNDKTEGFSP